MLWNMDHKLYNGTREWAVCYAMETVVVGSELHNTSFISGWFNVLRSAIASMAARNKCEVFESEY
jgi:hypothetical protein